MEMAPKGSKAKEEHSDDSGHQKTEPPKVGRRKWLANMMS